MLVKLGAFGKPRDEHPLDSNGQFSDDTRSLELRCIDMEPGDAARERLRARLKLTVETMEARITRYTWNATIAANLLLLEKTFSMSRTEKAILVLAASLRTDDNLAMIASRCNYQVDVTDQLHRVLGISLEKIRRAVSPQSNLRRSGLITVSGGGHLAKNLQLQHGRLRCIVTSRLKSIDSLFSGILGLASAPTLTMKDYPHVNPSVGFLSEVMGEATTSGRSGVNILLYGPPGTGKTELTRVVAQHAHLPLYEVSCVDENLVPLDASSRLSSVSTAQYLLRGRKSLLVFDEIDAIFNDGSVIFGKPATAELSKAWVNQLLENGCVPTFWVANSVGNMDPAFVRRFDVVIEMKTPPLRQRVELLEAQCGLMLDTNQVHRIARVSAMTPAVVTRAANVMARISVDKEDQVATLEAILDGTLTAQGHKTIAQENRALPSIGYDPDLCNANIDLRTLASGLGISSAGRICLYGPPGTGKTAFGYWLAAQLGKPLILKRISDIQSPMLGVMERNLAHAFEQASRDGAILQIDEIDGFLRDRREARQGWEVSQVNEFLTQLEGYEGVFIASTNLMAGLDPAALRRFDYKVSIGYLLPHQRRILLSGLLDQFRLNDELSANTLERLHRLDALTPGDFAVLRRQQRITAFSCADAVVEALAAEVAGKEPLPSRRIGFV
jgi:transitional endoplasmic reticulum ATPase